MVVLIMKGIEAEAREGSKEGSGILRQALADLVRS
jgi:hypothetical protein